MNTNSEANVPTGFTDLDRLIGGLHRGDLIAIGGRPSSGKTALILNIATQAALRNGAVAALFSLEASKEQLVKRIMIAEDMGPSEYRIVTYPEQNVVSIASLIIDDTPALTTEAVFTRCLEIKKQQGLDVVFIDYLQLIGELWNTESRAQAASELTKTLKELAVKLDVPLIVPSQLPKTADRRPGHVPCISDFWHFVSIEKDADVIAMLYRPATYFDTPEHKEGNNITYLDVQKNRNGITGRISLDWEPERIRFINRLDPGNGSAE